VSSGRPTEAARAPRPADRRRWLTLGILRVALTLVAGGATGIAVSSLGNTLHADGSWESGKIGLGVPVMGAAATWVTRPALAGRRLDLGSWFGHQEVGWRAPVSLDSLSLSAEIPEGAYLDLWFDAEPRHGVRLSRRGDMPSGVWTMQDGRFVTFEAIAPSVPRTTRPSLHFGTRRRLELGTATIDLPGAGPASGFGVRGGLASAWVDEVAFRTGRRRVSHSFDGRPGLPAATAAIAVWLLASASRRRWGPLAAVAMSGLTALLGLAAVEVVDRTAAFIPDDDAIDYGPYPQETTTLDQVRQRLRQAPSAPGPRVLVLGSSQTWGSGATDLDATWVRRACGKASVTCLNGGVPGATAAIVAPFGRQLVEDLAPDGLVVVLAHNDADPARLAANAGALVDDALRRGVRVLLVGEPTNPELGADAHDASRAAMRATAEERGVPYLDMQPWMDADRAGGWLWWDAVHLTDAGHARFASGIAPALTALVLEE